MGMDGVHLVQTHKLHGRVGAICQSASIFKHWLAPWYKRRITSKPAQSTKATSTTSGGYTTLVAPHYIELEVKKSKFLTNAWPVATPSEALALIQANSNPVASHNCFAYKVGQEYRSSDDGEPSGTAGRPILSAIEGEGVDRVCVLVTRFFGGTKLGAGGLVRAYGGAARECLKMASKAVLTPKLEMQLESPYEVVGRLYQLIEQCGAERLSEDYSEPGAVRLRLRVEASVAERLRDAVRDASSGRAVLEDV